MGSKGYLNDDLKVKQTNNQNFKGGNIKYEI